MLTYAGHTPVLEMAERSGLLAKIGTDQIFETAPAAVARRRTRH